MVLPLLVAVFGEFSRLKGKSKWTQDALDGSEHSGTRLLVRDEYITKYLVEATFPPVFSLSFAVYLR